MCVESIIYTKHKKNVEKMITKFCANSDTIHLGYFYVTIILNGE